MGSSDTFESLENCSSEVGPIKNDDYQMRRKTITRMFSIDASKRRSENQYVMLPKLQYSLGNNSRSNSLIFIDFSRLSPASKLLTKAQQRAFYKAFKFFDHKKNDRISAEEFVSTLVKVGLPVNKKAVQDLMGENHDESGGMTYEDYLNFMTSDGMFDSLMKGGGREGAEKADEKSALLHQVLSKLIKKSVLREHQQREIVTYYMRKLRAIFKTQILSHAEHVIHHYGDAARSLGLTEKEIFNQIKVVKEQALKETDQIKKNSPYANPLQLVLTAKDMNRFPERRFSKEPGWKSRKPTMYRVKLPSVGVHNKKTIENVREIRTKIDDAKVDYYKDEVSSQQESIETISTDL